MKEDVIRQKINSEINSYIQSVLQITQKYYEAFSTRQLRLHDGTRFDLPPQVFYLNLIAEFIVDERSEIRIKAICETIYGKDFYALSFHAISEAEKTIVRNHAYELRKIINSHEVDQVCKDLINLGRFLSQSFIKKIVSISFLKPELKRSVINEENFLKDNNLLEFTQRVALKLENEICCVASHQTSGFEPEAFSENSDDFKQTKAKVFEEMFNSQVSYGFEAFSEYLIHKRKLRCASGFFHGVEVRFNITFCLKNIFISVRPIIESDFEYFASLEEYIELRENNILPDKFPNSKITIKYVETENRSLSDILHFVLLFFRLYGSGPVECLLLKEMPDFLGHFDNESHQSQAIVSAINSVKIPPETYVIENDFLVRFKLFLENFSNEFSSIPLAFKENPENFLEVAYMLYVNFSCRKDSITRRISEAVMALESLFLAEDERDGKKKLGSRVPKLLSLIYHPSLIMDSNLLGKAILNSYDIRSSYLHGIQSGTEYKRRVRRAVENFDRLEIMFKHLQDFVRVSIIVFMSLNERNISKKNFCRYLDGASVEKVCLISLEDALEALRPMIGATICYQRS